MRAPLTGLVPVRGVAAPDQGSLAGSLLHGESLHVHAARALRAAGPPVDLLVPPGGAAAARRELEVARLSDVGVREDGGGLGSALERVLQTCRTALVVHDPLCPLVPASFLRDVCAGADADLARERAVVAVRTVTDTVKRVVDGRVVGTLDRHALRVVASPLVLPAAPLRALAASGQLQRAREATALVAALRSVTDVRFVLAPALARRVSSRASLELLEELQQVQEHLSRPRRG